MLQPERLQRANGLYRPGRIPYRADVVALASRRALMALASAVMCQDGEPTGDAAGRIALDLLHQIGVFMMTLNGQLCEDESVIRVTEQAMQDLVEMTFAQAGWNKDLARNAVAVMDAAPEVYAQSGRVKVGTAMVYIRNKAPRFGV